MSVYIRTQIKLIKTLSVETVLTSVFDNLVRYKKVSVSRVSQCFEMAYCRSTVAEKRQ